MELTGQIVFDVIILIGGFLAAWAYNRVYTLLDRLDLEMKQIFMTYLCRWI